MDPSLENISQVSVAERDEDGVCRPELETKVSEDFTGPSALHLVESAYKVHNWQVVQLAMILKATGCVSGPTSSSSSFIFKCER